MPVKPNPHLTAEPAAARPEAKLTAAAAVIDLSATPAQFVVPTEQPAESSTEAPTELPAAPLSTPEAATAAPKAQEPSGRALALAQAAARRAQARTHLNERAQTFALWHAHWQAQPPHEQLAQRAEQRYELPPRTRATRSVLSTYLDQVAAAPQLQHHVAEVLPLKAELHTKLMTQCPPKAQQITALSKALRSHPIALVPEALHGAACARRPEQQLSCDYQAYLLGVLKTQPRTQLFNQCLSSVVAPQGLSLEHQAQLDCLLESLTPQAWLSWAHGAAELPAFQAYHAQMAQAWTEDDLAAFECCAYELGERAQSADVKRFTLALEQRRQCMEFGLQPIVASIITLLSLLKPAATTCLLHKLQPLMRCDGAAFTQGLRQLGATVPARFALVALLSLPATPDAASAAPDAPDAAAPTSEPQPEAQTEAQREAQQAAAITFLRGTELKLRGRLRQQAERNDAVAQPEADLQLDPESDAQPEFDQEFDTKSTAQTQPTSDLEALFQPYADEDDAPPEEPSSDEPFVGYSTNRYHDCDSDAAPDPVAEPLPTDYYYSDISDDPEWEDASGDNTEVDFDTPEFAPDCAVAADDVVAKGEAEGEAETSPDDAADATAVPELAPEAEPAVAPQVGAEPPRFLPEDEATGQRFAQLNLALIAPVAINNPEVPCVFQPVPPFSADCTLQQEPDQPELWRITAPQCYGIQRCFGTCELITPVWTNMRDRNNWFGGRVATRPYTYILPQELTACDEQGVPQAQFVSSMADGYTPRVEYLLHETIAAEELKSYFLDPDYLEQVRADFAQSWLNTNDGAGFELCSDPSNPAYLGYQGEAAARALHYHGSVEECTMSAYPPVYLDRLHLEQLYLSSVSPTADHPYGQAVEVMYPQFLNALRWVQAQAAQAAQAEFNQLNAVATQLSDLLGDAAVRAHWWADRCLNFEVSCTIVNQSSERKVSPNIHYCNWVANQAQYDLLMEARKSEAQLKRDIRDLSALVTAHNLPLINPYLSAQSPVGALYATAVQQQLTQGQAAFDYRALPQLPQGLLPPQLSPDDNAVFLLNRAHQLKRGQRNFLGGALIADLEAGLRAPIAARTKFEWCNLPLVTAPAPYATPTPEHCANPPQLAPHVAAMNATVIYDGASWSGYATQLYGERTHEVQVELIRPVLTNQRDPQCWYGGRAGPTPGVYVRPEPIGTVDESGIPQVLISHDESLELNPVVEQLLCTSDARTVLGHYLVTPEVATKRRQLFAAEWQNTNDGQGFSVTTDASTPEYCGRDRYDTTSEEEWARYAMVMSPAELKADNALRQQQPCDLEALTQAHAAPLEYDHLLLEQLITANCRPDAAHPHGLVATLMFPQYDHALHYGKLRCLMLSEGEERRALKAQLKRLEDALHEASDSALWMADRILNFEASCDLTNSGLSPRPVERDLHRCAWVYNRAQYWCLIDARRGEVNVKRDLALLRQLAQGLPVAPMRLTRTSALGLKYDLCRHQQLLAGKCAFDFKDLPQLPAGLLPPLMSSEDNARFVLNRRRYQALKLGATAVEALSEAELLRFLQQAHAQRAQRLAAALAQGTAQDTAQDQSAAGAGGIETKVKGLKGWLSKLLCRR